MQDSSQTGNVLDTRSWIKVSFHSDNLMKNAFSVMKRSGVVRRQVVDGVERKLLLRMFGFRQIGNMYWLCHYKQIREAENLPHSPIKQEDMDRLNCYARLLAKWNLINLLEPEKIKTTTLPAVHILKSQDVVEYTVHDKITDEIRPPKVGLPWVFELDSDPDLDNGESGDSGDMSNNSSHLDYRTQADSTKAKTNEKDDLPAEDKIAREAPHESEEESNRDEAKLEELSTEDLLEKQREESLNAKREQVLARILKNEEAARSASRIHDARTRDTQQAHDGYLISEKVYETGPSVRPGQSRP